MALIGSPCLKFSGSLKHLQGTFTVVARYICHPFLPPSHGLGKSKYFLVCTIFSTFDVTGRTVSVTHNRRKLQWAVLIQQSLGTQLLEATNENAAGQTRSEQLQSCHDLAEGAQGCNVMNTEQVRTINSVLQPLHTISLCAAHNELHQGTNLAEKTHQQNSHKRALLPSNFYKGSSPTINSRLAVF